MYTGPFSEVLRETHAARNGSCQPVGRAGMGHYSGKGEKPDLDPLGWTDREFHPRRDTGTQAWRHQGERCRRDEVSHHRNSENTPTEGLPKGVALRV